MPAITGASEAGRVRGLAPAAQSRTVVTRGTLPETYQIADGQIEHRRHARDATGLPVMPRCTEPRDPGRGQWVQTAGPRARTAAGRMLAA